MPVTRQSGQEAQEVRVHVCLVSLVDPLQSAHRGVASSLEQVVGVNVYGLSEPEDDGGTGVPHVPVLQLR